MTSRTVLLLGLVVSLDPCSKLGINLQADPPASSTPAPQVAPLSVEETALADAKKLCAQGDFQYAHERLASTLPAGSPLRQTADFKDIENKWAAATTTGASDDPDLLGRRRALDEVSKSTSVDPAFQAKAKSLLLSLPTQASALPEIKSGAGAGNTLNITMNGINTSEEDWFNAHPDMAVKQLLPGLNLLTKKQAGFLFKACKKLNDKDCMAAAKTKMK